MASSDIRDYSFSSLKMFASEYELNKLPYSIKILLENMIRGKNWGVSSEEDIENVISWNPNQISKKEIPFMPSRVVLQDFTGVPAVVDLATMRDAANKLGFDPKKVNPLVRSDLVIDHSVQVDYYNVPDALKKNTELEFQRNRERYQFLKWGQQAFNNFRIIPPGVGIVHQVNLEYLAPGIIIDEKDGKKYVYPDSCIGTDSHTTMINGLGVLGWGVGGIEAEAVMLGQPYYMKLPEVIGVNLYGQLKEGTTATDLVLSITQVLRNLGVVEKFVEFFGIGLNSMSLQDRATIANMAPEYGATCGFFPIDYESLNYLKNSGRDTEVVNLAGNYAKDQLMFHNEKNIAEYNNVVDFDLSSVMPSLSGPKRPQDKIFLNDVKKVFSNEFSKINQSDDDLSDGSVVVAAITSCTNTSNPSVMVGAGLLAKNLEKVGLKPKRWVKTSMAPGSRVVTSYLSNSGLDKYLDNLGFNTVGFGCTTCIGNSGPLDDEVSEKIENLDLVVASVLSGNRNFEGRIHPLVKANFLASPLLVIAYAIAGTVNIDMTKDPLGKDSSGQNVYLSDVWPSSKNIQDEINKSISPNMYKEQYENAISNNNDWNTLESSKGEIYNWDSNSSYIQKVPFFDDFSKETPEIESLKNARLLCVLGDSVTTDHISPAGSIPELAPSGQFLISSDIPRSQFNSYGSRRGNHNIMARGTFGNIRLRNLLTPDREGDWTVFFPEDKEMRIFEAAKEYEKSKTPLIVIAGKEYGTGSSRDWAAKGPNLLGVRAVIAESFERIHRSNLIGMGITPFEFIDGENFRSLGLSGDEYFDFEEIGIDTKPLSIINIEAKRNKEIFVRFKVKLRVDTEIEKKYLFNGGVLQFVLRDMVSSS
ncbi:MAG: aconitate hydratase AcnA [Chloroflexi bacterium]|nr:aconitate hydratase AcnA [Chloroflexota bacterium]